MSSVLKKADKLNLSLSLSGHAEFIFRNKICLNFLSFLNTELVWAVENQYSKKTKTHLSCIFNTVVADVLTM